MFVVVVMILYQVENLNQIVVAKILFITQLMIQLVKLVLFLVMNVMKILLVMLFVLFV